VQVGDVYRVDRSHPTLIVVGVVRKIEGHYVEGIEMVVNGHSFELMTVNTRYLRYRDDNDITPLAGPRSRIVCNNCAASRGQHEVEHDCTGMGCECHCRKEGAR
jgi:hypothetical protein